MIPHAADGLFYCLLSATARLMLRLDGLVEAMLPDQTSCCGLQSAGRSYADTYEQGIGNTCVQGILDGSR